MEHFRILPTDSRYKELTVEQMEALFMNAIRSMSDDEHREIYRKHAQSERLKNTLPVDTFKEMGYSSTDIAEIKRSL